MPVTVLAADSPEHIEIARGLLRDYAGFLNRSLGAEHICLDAYERELAGLPAPYTAPDGTLLLAFSGERAVGCAALKPLKPARVVAAGEAACEMKRLWVRAEFRGQSIGLALAEELIRFARGHGYSAMYLDTVPGAMKSANNIYRKLGFVPVARYNTNPVLGPGAAAGVEFFRLTL